MSPVYLDRNKRRQTVPAPRLDYPLPLDRPSVGPGSGSGCNLLDATLAEDAAMGLLFNQTYQLIAAHCIQKSAQAAIQAFRRNVARNTTFHY